MNIPRWCKDCDEYVKSERECIIVPTKPFRKGCNDHGKHQKQEVIGNA